jgi:hypothetical protein
MDDKGVVFFGHNNAGNVAVVCAAISFHLSRLQGRSDCIVRCNPGGGSLHNMTRGESPTPPLPRIRLR